jgi:hypothetical protein
MTSSTKDTVQVESVLEESTSDIKGWPSEANTFVNAWDLLERATQGKYIIYITNKRH